MQSLCAKNNLICNQTILTKEANMLTEIRSLTLSALTLCIAMPAFAASHREAPMIANDPTADITDFYIFRSWQDMDKAILIMNVIPSQDPGSGPNYFNYADDVLYETHDDNNRNNVAANNTYQIRSKTETLTITNDIHLDVVRTP